MTNTSQLIRSQDALALESDLKCSVVNSKFQSTQPPLCNTNRYPSFELWGVEDSVLHVFEFRDLRFQLLGYTHLHPARLRFQNRTQVALLACLQMKNGPVLYNQSQTRYLKLPRYYQLQARAEKIVCSHQPVREKVATRYQGGSEGVKKLTLWSENNAKHFQTTLI